MMGRKEFRIKGPCPGTTGATYNRQALSCWSPASKGPKKDQYDGAIFLKLWGLEKMDPFFGSPRNKDHSILGLILGPLNSETPI